PPTNQRRAQAASRVTWIWCDRRRFRKGSNEFLVSLRDAHDQPGDWMRWWRRNKCPHSDPGSNHDFSIGKLPGDPRCAALYVLWSFWRHDYRCSRCERDRDWVLRVDGPSDSRLQRDVYDRERM